MVSVQAQNLNGTVNNAFYGSALAVQTINTSFGNSPGGGDATVGSELDAAYGAVSGGNLYLFLAGNFEDNGNHLNVFVDGGAVGESTLSTSGGSLAAMNGSVFSPGFQATWAFDMNDYSGTLYNENYNLVGGSQVSGGYIGSLAGSGGIYAGGYGGDASLYLNNTHASTMGAAGTALSGAPVVPTRPPAWNWLSRSLKSDTRVARSRCLPTSMAAVTVIFPINSSPDCRWDQAAWEHQDSILVQHPVNISSFLPPNPRRWPWPVWVDSRRWSPPAAGNDLSGLFSSPASCGAFLLSKNHQ